MKTGYRFLMKENSVDLAPVQPSQNGGIWKIIWAPPVPNKVKSFVWRSCSDATPVKINLRRRQILVDDGCDHCHSSPETVLLVVWSCPEIPRVWKNFPELDCHRSHRFSLITNLLLYAHGEGNNLELLAMLMWTIWFCQN